MFIAMSRVNRRVVERCVATRHLATFRTRSP
jgi:hypothetical protein